jgi:hypothetical protein
MSTATARTLQAGGPDAYGHAPERCISDGDGIPCRHCLDFVPEGEPYLVLAHRPFDGLNPYTETGPIFLCAKSCEAGGGERLPAFLDSPSYILRGYDAGERILYGTGAVTPTDGITRRAEDLLAREDVAFVHIRSASNNCFHCRIERG